MIIVVIVVVAFVTTLRHEAAHAFAALLTGVPVREVRLLPGIDPDKGFYFGYVALGDGGGWVVDVAPYVAALAWLGLCFPAVRMASGRSRRLRLFVFALGMGVLAVRAAHRQGMNHDTRERRAEPLTRRRR